MSGGWYDTDVLALEVGGRLVGGNGRRLPLAECERTVNRQRIEEVGRAVSAGAGSDLKSWTEG